MRRSHEHRFLASRTPVAPPSFKPLRAILPTLLTAVMMACAPPSMPERSLELTACRVGELNVPAQCGSLTVPEDAREPSGRKIAIRVAVLRAVTGGSRMSPLLILVGGPGQAATSSGVPIARLLADVRRNRDVVLVDQRGTGGSRALRCQTDDRPFGERFNAAPNEAEIAACHRALGADTALYSTPHAIGDYEAVRVALGYARWNLWGGSYGTRVALAYMQAHPQSVERVVLDGAAPTDIELPLHFAADGQASLDGVVSACARTPECALAHPRLKAVIGELLARIGDSGITVRVTHPSRGTSEEVHMARAGFLGGLRTLLYSSELAALLPFALTRAHENSDWNPFVASVTAITDMMSTQVEHLGMYLSVICAEDVPRIANKNVAALTAGTVFGTTLVEQARTSCGSWKSAQVPASYYDPVRQPHATLILSGALDPVTPPRWGALIANRLPNSLHVVAPTSHGVTPLGCTPQVVADFFNSSNPLSTDTRCIAEIPVIPFFTHPTGP